MATTAGYTGSVTFGGGAVSVVKKWDFEDKADLEDVTGMASGASGRKSFGTNLVEGSGSFEGLVDTADAKFKGAPPAIRAGATGTATFVAATGFSYAMTVTIESFKVTSAVDQQVAFTCTYRGSGAVTWPS